MKKVLILNIAISLFAVLTKTKAMINEYDEIAKSDKADVTLYAKKMNGVYTDFKINRSVLRLYERKSLHRKYDSCSPDFKG
ncbi:hypothetical protein [Lysinibacillus sp. NPDC093688]|uniref:hypothetical protein n=1 Tax=Lysinibacillus sp. NPDC093688 TaxID=3390577 RepID=UPI003D054E33